MTPNDHQRRVEYICRAKQARFEEWHNIPPARFVDIMLRVDAFLDSLRGELRFQANMDALKRKYVLYAQPQQVVGLGDE